MSADDRTLLENAARAAGMPVNCHDGWTWCQNVGPSKQAGLWKDVAIPTVDNPNPRPSPKLWNPLLSDGQTLRLAMALMMTIRTGPCMATAQAVWLTLRGVFIEEESIYQGTDVAVRRAVVRAAATIWEARS